MRTWLKVLLVAGTIVLYGFAMVMIAWTFLLHSQPTALPDTTPDKVREAMDALRMRDFEESPSCVNFDDKGRAWTVCTYPK